MTFIDPDRPAIESAEPLPASAFDGQLRMGDGWTANRPRSSGLMLAGGIIVALMVAGWVTFSGMIEIGRTTNTSPMTTGQQPHVDR
jgi:hypothetical protein